MASGLPGDQVELVAFDVVTSLQQGSHHAERQRDHRSKNRDCNTWFNNMVSPLPFAINVEVK